MVQLICWVFLNQTKKRHIINIDFGPNKTPLEIIKEGTFGGTYFRDIYSGVNHRLYNKSWKEFDELGNIDQNYYFSNY